MRMPEPATSGYFLLKQRGDHRTWWSDEARPLGRHICVRTSRGLGVDSLVTFGMLATVVKADEAPDQALLAGILARLPEARKHEVPKKPSRYERWVIVNRAGRLCTCTMDRWSYWDQTGP